jgi:putative PIN family toxin of toxin-antitoxin system
MRIKRFVLDNNIWVSHFITKSEQKLIDIIADNKLKVFTCDELYEEITRVLNYPRLEKYGVDIAKALKTVKNATYYHKLAYPIKRYVPGDENDDYLIALALQTSSGFITSGDDDILSQKASLEKKYKKLKILTKAEFEEMFG